MSLQWTFVATFLYTEIFVVMLLLIPFFSASRWQKIFRSRLLSSFRYYANIYFNIFIIVLIILFFDSVRDVRRYSEVHDDFDTKLAATPHAEATLHMKLFRAQRNFYIAGFALFLFLVLRRLVTLISRTATMEADVEATRKQAESATAAAKKLLDDKDNKSNEATETKVASAKLGSVVDAALESNETVKQLDQTRLELEKNRQELHISQLDLATMRKQAESTNQEYDRLLQEHARLQSELKKMEGSGDTKKDD